MGKTIVGAVVEQRELTAGSARLAALDGVAFDGPGPFVCGVIDGRETTARTDSWKGYRPLEAAGVSHDPHTRGKHAMRLAEILPWSHRIFSSLKCCLRETFRGVNRSHLQRYLGGLVCYFYRRWKKTDFFGFVSTPAVEGTPFPYRRLIAEQGE